MDSNMWHLLNAVHLLVVLQNGNLNRFPYKSYSEAITVVVVTLLRDVLEQEKGTDASAL